MAVMRRHPRPWTLLLGLALVGWLWLAAVHTHGDEGSPGGAAHAACQLCAGLDRAAAPPPETVVAIPRPAGTVALPTLAATALPVGVVLAYAPRGPPCA